MTNSKEEEQGRKRGLIYVSHTLYIYEPQAFFLFCFFSPQKNSSDTEHRYGNLALNENEDQKKLQALL